MEIRVTVQVLDENGNVFHQSVVLGDHDEAGLQGDVEAALDEAIEAADNNDE